MRRNARYSQLDSGSHNTDVNLFLFSIQFGSASFDFRRWAASNARGGGRVNSSNALYCQPSRVRTILEDALAAVFHGSNTNCTARSANIYDFEGNGIMLRMV